MSLITLSTLDTPEVLLASSTLGVSSDYVQVSGVAVGQPLTFSAILTSDSSVDISTIAQVYDWSQAPSWANWAAYNEDGTANWYSERPIIDDFRGRWMYSYSDRRNWPIYTAVKLYRNWRSSLGSRAGVTTTVTEYCSCNGIQPQPGDTILTDAISYIQVGLGNVLPVPTDCSCISTTTTTIVDTAVDSYEALIGIECSTNGTSWKLLDRILITSDGGTGQLNVSGVVASAEGPYFRAYLMNITGPNAYVVTNVQA